MALTTTHCEICLGSRYNTKQAKVGIPAGGSGEDPGLLVLEGVDATGSTYNRLYVWADSSNALRYHTSAPTNENSDGSVLATTTSTGANRYMSNLLATTINTSLISDTDSTDDLGSSSAYWANAYVDKVYLNSTATIDGSTAGKHKIVGNIDIGVDGTGHDVIFYGDTATSYMWWDMSADALIFEDETFLKFGTGADIVMDWDGTDFNIDSAADDSVVVIGEANDLDVRFVSHDNANQDAGWISDIYTFQVCDSAILQLGGGAFDTVTDGVQLIFDGSDTLNIDAVTANDTVRFGETTITDVYFDGANGYDMLWDGSADALILKDNVTLDFGTGSDFTMTYDGSDFLIEPAAANDGFHFGSTTQFDITLHGATAGSDVTWDASADTLTVLDDVKLAFGDADDMYFLYAAANTLSLLQTVAGTGQLMLGVDNKGIDCTWYAETAGDYMKWDQDGGSNLGALIFEDSIIQVAGANVTYDIGISTDTLAITGTDHANANVTIGEAGTTNSVNLTLQSITAGDTVVFDAGAKTVTFTDVAPVLGVNSTNQGYLTIWDGAGGNTPAYILMHSPNGTAHYLFFEDDGTLKQHTSAPTQNSDGNEIGGQS
jgi:hypothetical protein